MKPASNWSIGLPSKGEGRRSLWIGASAFLAFLIITVVLLLMRERLQSLAQLGYAGAFVSSLVSSATVILPVPGLAITYGLGGSLPNPWLVGLAAGLGETIGELTGYLAGYSGRAIVDDRERYERLAAGMRRYGPGLIFALAAIPNPTFDLAGIAAGALKMPVSRFLLACLPGKILKTTAFALAGAGLLPLLADLLAPLMP